MLGLPLSTYFGKPDRIADGQLRLLERFDADAVYAFPHIVQDVLPWGSQIDLHDDGPPSVRGMIVREHLDAARLVAPDPTRHPYTRGTLATAERLARAVKGERLIVGAVIGPFFPAVDADGHAQVPRGAARPRAAPHRARAAPRGDARVLDALGAGAARRGLRPRRGRRGHRLALDRRRGHVPPRRAARAAPLRRRRPRPRRARSRSATASRSCRTSATSASRRCCSASPTAWSRRGARSAERPRSSARSTT